MKKIEILGTAYQFSMDEKGLEQQNADGICWCYGKKIQVKPPERMLGPSDTMEKGTAGSGKCCGMS